MQLCGSQSKRKNYPNTLNIWGTAVAHTNRKVAGSIPAAVTGIFHPSDRTMALGSTQPLTEMSTRSISWE